MKHQHYQLVRWNNHNMSWYCISKLNLCESCAYLSLASLYVCWLAVWNTVSWVSALLWTRFCGQLIQPYMLTQKPRTINVRTIFKPLIPQTHAIRYVNGFKLIIWCWISQHTTTIHHRSCASSEAHVTMHYLDGIILLIIYIRWWGSKNSNK